MDSTDTERLEIAKAELFAMLEEEDLKDAILLIMANKQDAKGALSSKELSEAMGLAQIRNRQWSIQETSATQGKGEFAMEYKAHEPVSGDVKKELLKKYEAERLAREKK